MYGKKRGDLLHLAKMYGKEIRTGKGGLSDRKKTQHREKGSTQDKNNSSLDLVFQLGWGRPYELTTGLDSRKGSERKTIEQLRSDITRRCRPRGEDSYTRKGNKSVVQKKKKNAERGLNVV